MKLIWKTFIIALLILYPFVVGIIAYNAGWQQATARYRIYVKDLKQEIADKRERIDQLTKGRVIR